MFLKSMPVLLELFCGTKFIGKIFDQHGWDVVSVDVKKKFEPTICKNVLDLTPEDIFKAMPAFSQTEKMHLGLSIMHYVLTC